LMVSPNFWRSWKASQLWPFTHQWPHWLGKICGCRSYKWVGFARVLLTELSR
jgi:hypothetical protein